MSKKFIRVLGIGLIIVLLPVLIVSTAIALDRSKPTYSVETKYGAETKIVYDESSEIWSFDTLPTRAFYSFKGVTVEGLNGVFEVNEKKQIVVGNEQKEAFKEAIAAKKKIESVWACVYSDIYIGTGSDWNAKDGAGWDIDENTSITFLGGSIDAIEEIMLFDLVDYNYAEYPLTQIKIKTLTAEGNWIINPITISYDTSISGDMSISTLLSKIVEKGTILNTLEGNVLKVLLYN